MQKTSDKSAPPQETDPIDLEIDLRNFLLMLWRRKLLILSVMMIVVALVFFFVNTVQPRYTAKSLVLIESRYDPGPELRALISNMRVDTTLVISEAEVLKSRGLAAKVIERLDLMNDPEFNPKLKSVTRKSISDILNQPGGMSASSGTRATNFKTLSVYDTQNAVIRDDTGLVIDRFLKHLTARPIPGSFVLQVEFTSNDAAKSALIANAVVDIYIEQRLEKKFQATQKLSGWLDERLEDLREQLRESEAAVENFRSDNNLVSGARTEVTVQQLSELNSQLVIAQSKKAEAQARLDQVRDWIENPGSIASTSEASNSRIIQNLKIKEADILNQIAEMSARYGDKHPTMINARSELKDTRKKISQELENVVEKLKGELKVANARVGELEKSINNVEQTRLTENQANIELRELRRESESNQIIFDTFLKTYKKADEREKLEEPDARVISYATTPRHASYPNKPLFLSLSAIASFFLGIALAMLLEKLDNAYRTSSQIEKETGYPCFGVIPRAKKLRRKHPVADFILSKPSSNVAEAVRTLRMTLNLRSKAPDQKTKIVTITSSLPDEGKTTLSSWLGRTSARSGEKVLIIDCDLRRPRLHEAFGKKPDGTIVEFLTGKSPLEQVVYKDKASGADVLFARAVPSNALDLISKERMKNLIIASRERYDLVILDTPASLAVSDARLLASLSDQTLFAVSWDRTPREVVNAGVKQFADFGYERLSLVLTNVDIKRHSKYGYGDAVYYYSRYKKHYTD
ncbi:MAG: polysaccharide biosynthesis tyrosine autokinase [Alphaproteobacteria bacterium]|nr:polysaccharide biosynthesis tyrosine autokinase [Alphaproteobacteria bacterium]